MRNDKTTTTSPIGIDLSIYINHDAETRYRYLDNDCERIDFHFQSCDGRGILVTEFLIGANSHCPAGWHNPITCQPLLYSFKSVLFRNGTCVPTFATGSFTLVKCWHIKTEALLRVASKSISRRKEGAYSTTES